MQETISAVETLGGNVPKNVKHFIPGVLFTNDNKCRGVMRVSASGRTYFMFNPMTLSILLSGSGKKTQCGTAVIVTLQTPYPKHHRDLCLAYFTSLSVTLLEQALNVEDSSFFMVGVLSYMRAERETKLRERLIVIQRKLRNVRVKLNRESKKIAQMKRVVQLRQKAEYKKSGSRRLGQAPVSLLFDDAHSLRLIQSQQGYLPLTTACIPRVESGVVAGVDLELMEIAEAGTSLELPVVESTLLPGLDLELNLDLREKEQEQEQGEELGEEQEKEKEKELGEEQGREKEKEEETRLELVLNSIPPPLSLTFEAILPTTSDINGCDSEVNCSELGTHIADSALLEMLECGNSSLGSCGEML